MRKELEDIWKSELNKKLKRKQRQKTENKNKGNSKKQKTLEERK